MTKRFIAKSPYSATQNRSDAHKFYPERALQRTSVSALGVFIVGGPVGWLLYACIHAKPILREGGV
jgi:hypothetical protein